MDVPETRYARSGDLQIAYQVVGEGPLDILLVPSYLSNIEMFWELPSFARFFGRLSSFSRSPQTNSRGGSPAGSTRAILAAGVPKRLLEQTGVDLPKTP